MSFTTNIKPTILERFLFTDKRSAFIWLAVRLYLGWSWLKSGIGKVTNPSWVGEETGQALSGFVRGAISKASGENPTVSNWYASFLEGAVLPQAELFSYLVVFGEILVGVALILGILVGLAALGGVFMNMNFLLAGTLSSNPVMLVLGLLLVAAWRVAGHYGLDRFVLPFLSQRLNKQRKGSEI